MLLSARTPHAYIYTHIYEHINLDGIDFNCRKWAWKRDFISLEIEGLSRITEAAAEFPPLAGALLFPSLSPLTSSPPSEHEPNEKPDPFKMSWNEHENPFLFTYALWDR